MNHRPRKRFGQHFLTDPEIIRQIVSAVAPRPGEVIVEIGPGRGALTAPLAEAASNLHALEVDRDLAARLRQDFAGRTNVTIHQGDALRFDFSTLGSAIRLVGNLPYNISTPLLFHLLSYSNLITDAHFMLQKEVVERICAAPGSKDFGRLTVMLGCRMEAVPLFEVPPEAFSPPPRVTSAVIRMRPLVPGYFAIANPLQLERIVRAAFSKRRKTLRNALQGLVTATDIVAVGLDPACRPEQIGIADWVALANRISC